MLKLAPGHEKFLSDHWDYKIGYIPLGAIVKDGNLSRSHVLSGNVDEILATGDSFLKSYGDFKTKRSGNTVFVDGIVTHRWDDIYDFEPMKLLADGALSLEQHGRAKKYNIKSQWQQRLTGSMKIQKGRLINKKLEWEDIDGEAE